MVCSNAQKGSADRAQIGHVDDHGGRAAYGATGQPTETGGAQRCAACGAACARHTVLSSKRVTIIGKECGQNQTALHYLARDLLSNGSQIEKIYVGVQMFASLLEAAMAVERKEGPEVKCFGRPPEASSYDLVWRLGVLLDTDAVVCLPQGGRMTTVEALLARECEVPVYVWTEARGFHPLEEYL
jgi:hypothetical protein